METSGSPRADVRTPKQWTAMDTTIKATCEVAGWQSTGGVTLGLRFGSDARRFIDHSWTELVVELDGQPHRFPLRGSFWRHCPEVRGSAITAWLRRHGLAPWKKGEPPRVRLIHQGGNCFRAERPVQ